MASACTRQNFSPPPQPWRRSPLFESRPPPAPPVARARASPLRQNSTSDEVDVVIVGAGIVGLWTAYEALRRGQSVAVVDALRRSGGGGVGGTPAHEAGGASGGRGGVATGAGQGYVWQAHREPPSPLGSDQLPASSASWFLAARGKRRWERLGGGDDRISAALAARADLRRTGSLLLATTAEEAASLEARAARLCAAPGGPSEQDVRVLASAREVAADEPAFGDQERKSLVRAGLLVTSDAQIDGRGAAAGLLEACRALNDDGPGGASFREALEDGAASIEPATGGGGAGSGPQVETASGRRFRARRGVVVAGGAWTGGLLADALDRAGGAGGASSAAASWRAFFAPRRGHLLEVDAAAARLPAPLRRGAMELSYSRHYQQQRGEADGGGDGGGSDVTFTVTSGGGGVLLLGSSREDDAGFDGRADARVVAAILARAAEFLPTVRPLAEAAAASAGAAGAIDGVRVGLRPWAAGGLPAVGPVPGLPGVVVAAGHEGSGLTMAPATAELALRWIGLAEEEEEDDDDDEAWARAADLVRAELAPERRLAAAAAAAAAV